MAVMEILFGRKTATQFLGQGGLGQLTLDATLSAEDQFSSRITSFPVESGSSITDHILQEPETLSIEGFVTNTPIYVLGNLGAVASGRLTEYQEPVVDAYDFLLRMSGYSQARGDRKIGVDGLNLVDPLLAPGLVDIITEFRAYTSMAFERLSFPRNPSTGDALTFSATLKKVRFSDSKYGIMQMSNPPAAPRTSQKAAPKTNAGSVPTSEAKPGLQSWADRRLYGPVAPK